MSNVYRAFIKESIELFTIRIKTDNTGTSSSNQFEFTGAIGIYDVIARNEANNNIQTFSNLSGAATITFADGISTYELKIRPKGASNRFRKIQFANIGDRLKLLEIKKWGNVRWQNMTSAFAGCENLEVTATDIPDLSVSNDISVMFYNCGSLVGNTANWNWETSTIITMASAFSYASSFNGNIGSWNTSNVLSMGQMFMNALDFNQDISSWDVSNVMDMQSLFRCFTGFGSFNQDISSWNIGNVTNISYMFFGQSSFNQPIGSWNTSEVTNMEGVFWVASSFNQPIGTWNTSKVTSMRGIFASSSFNQDISSWNTGLVNIMEYMFYDTPFNQNIGAWNTVNVTNMQQMFQSTPSFNNGGSSDINNWNTSSVTNMYGMFNLAPSFNQPIGNWDVSSVINMERMFVGALAFNQNLGGWDISSVTNFINFMSGKTPSSFSAVNLDSIYNQWSSLLSVQPSINITFGSAKYNSTAQGGRDTLTGAPNNWTITDGGQV